jgi:hypothetical protein
MTRPIPAVNQVWDVGDGQLASIVSLTVPETTCGKDPAVVIRFSDGLTGVYFANQGGELAGYRLVWCPFGQHETNKERETT